MNRLLRLKELEKAGFNAMLLDSDKVELDFLTDSLKHSDLGASKHDTPSTEFSETVMALFGFPYSVALSQGRLAEALLANLLVKPNTVVPSNSAFITTQTHQQLNGAKTENVINPEAYSGLSSFAFKGNVDLYNLERVLRDNRVDYVSIELSNNQVGGQPISIDNLKCVRKLTAAHGVKIFLDGCRILNQAHQIQEREPGYSNMSIADIVREICSLADGMTLSLTKNYLLSNGALALFRDKELYERSFDFSLLMGDGLDDKSKKLINTVLYNEEENNSAVAKQMTLVKNVSEVLKNHGFTVLEPSGGHAVYIDLSDSIDKQTNTNFFFESLFAHWYLEYGIRASQHSISGIVRFAFPLTMPGSNKASWLIRSLVEWKSKGCPILQLERVYVPQGRTGDGRALYAPLDNTHYTNQTI